MSPQVTDRQLIDRRVTGRQVPGRRRQIRQPAERGSATIWLLGFLSLVLLISGVAVIQTLAVLARHRADTAADLAALAAAQRIGLDPDPCAAARRVAAENSATLTACSAQLDPAGRTGTVTIRLSRAVVLPLVGQRRVTARARAGRLPRHPPAGYADTAAAPAGVVAGLGGLAQASLPDRTRQPHGRPSTARIDRASALDPTEPSSHPARQHARWFQELVGRRVNRG